MRWSEFPTDLNRRDNYLPVGANKIVTIPGVRRCGKTSRMEVVVNDLLTQGVIAQLIQVTWDMNDEETRKREINGLIEASKATNCPNAAFWRQKFLARSVTYVC